jgi:hypothetical protein
MWLLVHRDSALAIAGAVSQWKMWSSRRALRRTSGAFVPSMVLVLEHCIWRLCGSIKVSMETETGVRETYRCGSRFEK